MSVFCARLLMVPAVLLLSSALPGHAGAQKVSSSSLPDTPQPAAITHSAQVIEPGETAPPMTSSEKLSLSLKRSLRPATIAPGLLSAGWGQLIDGDPKYGSDSGAFGERFGAAMLSSAITRALADGLFASIFHQDPRYYRVANGSIVHRGLLSAEQAITRRSDSGAIQPNYSAFAGKLASAALALTYYPPSSQTPGVVVETFATSIATGAGSNLVLEFFPDVARHVPFLRKFQVE